MSGDVVSSGLGRTPNRFYRNQPNNPPGFFGLI